MSIIRSIIKRNPLLYLLWFKLVRQRQKRSARLPRKGDDLFFTGFPRSGNTYFNYLIRYCFPNLKFASHLHTIASLKIAIKYNLKVIVTIRNPFDSVGSLLFTMSDGSGTLPSETVTTYVLKEYLYYYDFLIEKINEIYYIVFDEIVNDKIGTLTKLTQYLELEKHTLSEETISSYDDIMFHAEKKKDVRASSLPNKTKSIFKASIAESLKQNKNYNICVNRFEMLEKMITTNDIKSK